VGHGHLRFRIFILRASVVDESAWQGKECGVRFVSNELEDDETFRAQYIAVLTWPVAGCTDSSFQPIEDAVGYPHKFAPTTANGEDVLVVSDTYGWAVALRLESFGGRQVF